jgi:hypothetical protein
VDFGRHVAPQRFPSEVAPRMKAMVMAALLGSSGTGAAAQAAPVVAAAPPSAEHRPAPAGDQAFGHGRQFHVRAEVSTGYQMLLRYDTSPRCNHLDPAGTEPQKFCGLPAAPALGFAVGYAPFDGFEPFALLRLGLSDQAERTNLGKLVQAAVGARLYTMADSRFKFFFSPWIGVDLTSGPADASTASGSPGRDDQRAGVSTAAFRTDVLAHLDVGPQFDISKYVGVYVAGGLTFQMLRYLGATADLALGVQLRAP